MAQLVVRIEMAGASVLRSIESPATNLIQDLSNAIDFTHSEVFVIGPANSVVHHEKLANTSTGEGQTLAESVDTNSKVFVVANIPSADYTAVAALTSLLDIQNYASSVKSVNMAADSWKTVTLTNSNGFPATVGAVVGGVATAQVSISPATSRLELVAIKGGGDAMNHITEFKVTGVYVDDIFPHYNYIGHGTGDMKSLGTTTAVGDFTGWVGDYGAGDEGVWTGVAVVWPNLPTASPDIPATPTVTEIWGYNLAPDALSRLIMRITGIRYTTDGGETVKNDIENLVYYLTVTGYSMPDNTLEPHDADTDPDRITTFGRAHVYKVGSSAMPLVFTLDDLSEKPNTENITITANVTVVPWTIDQVWADI